MAKRAAPIATDTPGAPADVIVPTVADVTTPGESVPERTPRRKQAVKKAKQAPAPKATLAEQLQLAGLSLLSPDWLPKYVEGRGPDQVAALELLHTQVVERIATLRTAIALELPPLTEAQQIAKSVKEYHAACDFGAGSYKRADAILEDLQKRMKIDTPYPIGDGREVRLLDKFATKPKVFKQVGVSRYELKVKQSSQG
jgi:hypothetical protein